MDREAWRAAVHGVAKSRTRLSGWTELWMCLLCVIMGVNVFMCNYVYVYGPTLFGPMDYSLPGSSVFGILQARMLVWVAIPFSRGSSRPTDQTWVSCIAGEFFTIWATREARLLYISENVCWCVCLCVCECVPVCLYMCVYPWVLEGWHLTQMSITNPCPRSRPFVQDVCPIPLFLSNNYQWSSEACLRLCFKWLR